VTVRSGTPVGIAVRNPDARRLHASPRPHDPPDPLDRRGDTSDRRSGDPGSPRRGEGEPIRGGVRNPNPPGELRGETEIIARNGTYGTRQSNKGSGGGAIYGCRSDRDDEPCVRANNLRRGKAFEFETDGNLAGSITVGDDAAQPFTTNGRGRVENLHADRVDATDLAPIWLRMNAGTAATALQLGPLRLAAGCDASATPALGATTTAQNAVIHAIALSTGAPAGDDRRADGDFDPGETFTTGFGASHSGSIVYADDRVAVSVRLLTQRVGGACVVAGSAQGGPNV
jgi:hypothetical protein